MKRLLLVLLLVGMTSPALARETVFLTVNELHGFCTNGNPVDEGACIYYIVGISDGLNGVRKKDSPLFCAPQAASREQVADVAKQFLSNSPQSRHYAATYLVAEALSKAFP
jgi:hypothetical protein